MAMLNEIRGLAEYEAKSVTRLPTGLDEVSGHGGEAVPLFVPGYAFDPCTAPGRNRLCIAGGCGMRR